ncbi:MAG: TetR/AcrR family transcriptional regulator [Myxococcales bacterium]|nr:TetR/AcrR family transcriptional regulator [Myxococcales bacterium]
MPRARSPRRPLKAVRRPRQQRSQATVEALLEATARILERDGLRGLTTNHVAALAGVSIGSLYEYFDSKDALVQAWCEHHVANARALVDALFDGLAGTPMTDALEPFLDALLAMNLERPRLKRVLLEQIPTRLGAHPLSEIDDHIASRWLSLLRAERPGLDEKSVSMRLYALVRMGRAATTSWFVEGRPIERLPELKQALRDIIVASLPS